MTIDKKSSERFSDNIKEAILRGGVQGGEGEEGTSDSGDSENSAQSKDSKPKVKEPMRLVRANEQSADSKGSKDSKDAAPAPKGKPSLDELALKAVEGAEEEANPWSDIEKLLEDPEPEPDPEDNFEEDPELKDKPGAQKRIRQLLERTKAAEATVQQYTQGFQQVQAQAQKNYQLASQYQQQNQQLREMVSGFQARMDAFEKYGARQNQGEADPLDEFEQRVLKAAEGRFGPEIQKLAKQNQQYQQQVAQERRMQEQTARRQQFRVQGDKVAKSLLADIDKSTHDEKMEGMLYGLATSLALSHKLSIEEGGQMAKGLLKQYVKGFIKDLQGRSKVSENKKVSATPQGKQRVSGNQRKVMSNAEAVKSGLGKDSLSAAIAREGLARAK